MNIIRPPLTAPLEVRRSEDTGDFAIFHHDVTLQPQKGTLASFTIVTFITMRRN